MLALLHKYFFLVMVIYLSSEMFCDGSDEENLSHIYKNLLGFDFDMDYVIREYMKVCPTVTICGDKNESFIDTLTEYDLFNLPIQCPDCSCEQDCVVNNNCCPDVIYGYLQYYCVSSVKHKGKQFYNEEKFSMIASCPQSWVASHNMTKQRESILPVTSFMTGLTYQTVEFAQCNGDNKSLATWNTTFYCQKFTDFFEDVIINSFDELLRHLAERNCEIRLSVTYPTVPSQAVCDGPMYILIKKYLKEKEKVDKCNITGHWEKFDPYIDFACQHLSLAFGDYKNVFCYICNPGLSIQYHLNKITISTCDRAYSNENIRNACMTNEQTTYYLPYKNVFCLLCNSRPYPFEYVRGGLLETWVLDQNIDENIVARAIGQFFHIENSCKNTSRISGFFYETSLHETISLDQIEHSCTIPIHIQTGYDMKTEGPLSDCRGNNTLKQTNLVKGPIYNCSDLSEKYSIVKEKSNSSYAKEELLSRFILYIFLCDESVKMNNICESYTTNQINSFSISSNVTDNSLPCFICNNGNAYRSVFIDDRATGFDFLIKTVCPIFLGANLFLDTFSFLEAVRESDCSIWFYPTGVPYSYFSSILDRNIDDCIDFPWIDQQSCTNTEGSFYFGSYRKLFSIPNSNYDLEDILQVERQQSSNISQYCPQSMDTSTINTNDSCREIVCSHGHILINNDCRHEFETNGNVLYHLTFNVAVSKLEKRTALVKDARTYQALALNLDVIEIADICAIIQDVIRYQLNETILFSFTECIVRTDTICSENTITEIFIGSNIEIDIQIIIHFTKSLSIVENKLIGSSESVPSTLIVGQSGFQLFHLSRSRDLHLHFCFGVSYDTDSTFISNEFTVSKLLTCPQIELFENEYEIDNVSNTLLLLNTKNKVEDYDIIDRRVRICLDDFKANVQKVLQIPFLQKIYKVFDNVCTILSLLAILLAFITYLIFPSLRTVPGINNMSLIFSLFFAQLTLKFGIWQPTDMIVCPVVGIMIHFFWLATFCSMNICSFHMYRVFSSKSAFLFVVSRKTSVLYLLYTYLLPVLVIVLTICIHLALSDGDDFGYGRTICFLTHYISIIISFICPCVFVFLLNILFFLKTVFSMNRILSDPQLERSSERRDVFVYMRLSTLLGIAWPLLIVDAFFKMSVFSFIALTFNTLQGFFVFISFVCNKRVLFLYKSCIFGERLHNTT